jgi:hypothetical protein
VFFNPGPNSSGSNAFHFALAGQSFGELWGACLQELFGGSCRPHPTFVMSGVGAVVVVVVVVVAVAGVFLFGCGCVAFVTFPRTSALQT